jgi:hypothetical protein
MNRLLLLALYLFSATAHAQNWPSFRGAGAGGVADGFATATQWDGEKSVNLLWKVPIPGLALSSPIVWGDRVFVTSAVSSDPKPFRHGLYGDVEPSPDMAWQDLFQQ